MRIRPLKFRQRRHLDRNFWYTRRLLRKQSVRRQPGSSVASLHVLAQADVDRLASKEAERVSAAIEARRTTRRDAAVAKLEAMAEAYLSHVPSIPTLERLQDLEAFYNVSHAIPPRPLPPYRELPLSSVRFDYCMDLFHQNVKDLA